MVDSGGFWLSETPEKYSRSWQTAVIRCANWACFRCLENDATFMHLNTHLDHVSAAARIEGSRLMLSKMEELTASRGERPAVVTGDFNCRPGSPPYRIFAEEGFRDTFLAAGNNDAEDAYTFHAFKGTLFRSTDTDKPTGRIDWIMVRDGPRGVEVRSHEILRDGDEEAGRYPSDHYPILAELALDG
ncbi:MAG: endonuclease/exonuclease/phosphatase family protein [Actinomycetota bacterium]|nr:endonuclease/exonuclease/phosphatase family protein [Actinomycetota bacterium]